MRKLRYDWQRIQALVDALGEDFDSKISEAVVSNDLDTIALAVSIGSDDGVTAEQVKAESPPVVPTVNAIMEALMMAFHGTKEAPVANDDENPPVTGWWTSFVRRVRNLFSLG